MKKALYYYRIFDGKNVSFAVKGSQLLMPRSRGRASGEDDEDRHKLQSTTQRMFWNEIGDSCRSEADVCATRPNEDPGIKTEVTQLTETCSFAIPHIPRAKMDSLCGTPYPTQPQPVERFYGTPNMGMEAKFGILHIYEIT